MNKFTKATNSYFYQESYFIDSEKKKLKRTLCKSTNQSQDILPNARPIDANSNFYIIFLALLCSMIGF